MKKKININKKNLSKKQKIVAGVVSIALLGGGGFGFSVIKSNKEYNENLKKLVELYPISGKEKIFMSGKVIPVNSKEIFLEADQGEVDKIKVEDGQYVEKGTALFTSKNTEQIKEISNLNTQISNKKKEKQNAPDEESKKMIDEEIKSLNSQVATLNKTAYQTIYAPFNGKVYLGNDSVQEGTSKPVVIIDSTELYVKAQVNERDSYKININEDVELTAIATNKKYDGSISKIGDRPVTGDTLDQGNGNGMTQYGVNILLDNQENLKNGLQIQAVSLYGTDAKKVPNSAIFTEGNKSYVYKVLNSVATKVEVKVVNQTGEFSMVESKLRENDSIIRDLNGKNIEDGTQIYQDASEFER